MNIEPIIKAERVERAEGFPWRYTISDGDHSTAPLSAVQAGEVLEAYNLDCYQIAERLEQARNSAELQQRIEDGERPPLCGPHGQIADCGEPFGHMDECKPATEHRRVILVINYTAPAGGVPSDDVMFGVAIADHLRETFNDNGTLGDILATPGCECEPATTTPEQLREARIAFGLNP